MSAESLDPYDLFISTNPNTGNPAAMDFAESFPGF